MHKNHFGFDKHKVVYKIIIPQEEPKQIIMKKESIEEAAIEYSKTNWKSTIHAFVDGYNYSQQEISELKEQRDEMLQMLENNDHYTKKEIEQLIKKVKNEN
jgi:hypothetical protein